MPKSELTAIVKTFADIFTESGELRQSNRPINQIIEIVPSIVYVRDFQQQKNVFVNRGASKALGYTPQEIISFGNDFAKTVMHPEDYVRIPDREGKFETLKDGETVDFEYRMLHKSGEWRWFLSRDSVFLRDESGNPLMIIGTATDITEHKRIEEKLKESEDRFQLALAAVQSVIYDWNIAEDTITRSAELENLLGFSNDEPGVAHNKWWLTRLHPEDKERAVKLVKDAIESGAERFEDEYRLQHKDGNYVWVRDSGILLKDETGKAVRCVGSVRNINFRKQTEEALRESEERFRLAAQASGFGFHDYDVENNVSTWSPELRELVGFAPDVKITMETVIRQIHPDDRKRIDKLMQVTFDPQSNGEFAEEFRIIRADTGDVRWFYNRSQTFFTGKGKARRAVRNTGIVVDITERKRTEEQLRRNHETFFNLVKNTPFGVYIIDSDFRLVEISEGSQKVFSGIEPLIGRNFAEILRIIWEEPFASEAINIFRRTLETGEPYHAYSTTEQRGNKEDVESYDWKTERVTLPDGRFGVVCYFYDLTFQKQIQEELRRSEERLKLGIAVAEFAVCEIDYESGINHLSKEAARLYGLGEEEMNVPHEMFHATFHPDDAPELTKLIAKSLNPDSTGWFAHEHRIIHKNGNVRWLNVRKQIFFDRTTNPPRPTFGILAAQDITERKNQEAALSQSEERFRLASDAARALVYDVDLTGIRSVIVHGLELVTGYTNDESNLSSEWWRSLIHPEDLPNHIKNYNEHLEKGGIYKAVYRVLCKNGDYIWVEDTAQIVKDQEGRAVQLVGTIVDINDRYKSEKALRESEEVFRLASDAAAALVYNADLTGGRKTIVHGLERVTGYSTQEAELTGDWFHSLIHPEDLPDHLESLARQLSTEKTYKAMHRLRQKSGVWIWVEDTGQIIRDESGRATQLFGALVDITERKETEERLLEEKRFSQNIIEAAPSLTYIFDIATQSNVFISSSSLAILGYLPEEIQEMGADVFLRLLHPDDKEITQQRFEKFFADTSGEIFELEYRMRRKDRNYVWLFDRARVFRRDSRGKPTQILGVAGDVTLRKAAEEQLRYQLQLTQNITDSAAVAIFVSNAKREITFLNPEAEKIFGYTLKEIAGRNLHDVIHYQHPDGTPFPAEDCPLSKVFADGMAVRNYENTFYRRDGSAVYVVCSNTPILENNKVMGEVQIMLDISERKRREANLVFLADLQVKFAPLLSVAEITQKVGTRLAEYLKLTHCLFVEIDETKGTATVVHDEHADNSQSLLGVYKIGDFHSPVEQQKLAAGQTIVISNVRDDRDEKAAKRFESLGIRALINAPYIGQKGWTFVLSAQCDQPREWRNDECELLQELAERVYLRIERARTENALRESEERFRSLFESIDEGFVIVEMIFDENNQPIDYRFEQANPAFTRLTGLPQDALGKTVRELIPNLEEFWLETYGRVALTGEPIRFESKSVPMNRWFDVHASRIGGAGSHRVAIVFNNITERKEQEEKIQKSEERLRLATDAAEMFSWENDLITKKIKWSDNAAKIIGCNPEELSEDTSTSDFFIAPEERKRIWHEFEKALANGTINFAYEFKGKEDRFWQTHCLIMRGEAGNPIKTIGVTQDITIRKRAEEKIQMANYRFRLAEEAAKGFNYDWDLETGKTTRSLSIEHILGYKREELDTTWQAWTNLIHPDDVVVKSEDEAIEFLQNLQEDSFSGEYRVRHKHGHYIWLMERGLIVRNENGNPCRIIGQTMDVTERKEQEEKIRISEERYRALVEASAQVVWTMDAEGKGNSHRHWFAQLTGKSPEELKGKAYLEFIHPEDREDLQKYWQRIMKKPVPYEVEFRLAPDGKNYRYYNLRGVPLFKEDGTLREWIGTVRDITERKLAEENLRESEEFRRLLIESARDYAIIGLSANGIILSWNSGAELLYGYREEEIIGQPADILFTPEDRAVNSAQKEIEIALKRRSASDERWHLRKDGSRFFASGVLHELRNDSGQLLGFVKITRDQTDKLNAEKAIREHELLKKVVGALEDERNRIARDLHDELGQQLTALRLKLEHCRKSFSDPAIGEQIDEIQSIAQNIDNGVDFIAWQFRPAALDDLGLYAALDKFVSEWSNYSGVEGVLLPSSLKNTRFSFEVETNIYRIAQEALNNINKHAKAKRAELILEKRDNLIVLIIADDGIGFNLKNKNILNKGIGLLGMQERATLIDGKLEIESNPDEGTTIYVRVPISFIREEKRQ